MICLASQRPRPAAGKNRRNAAPIAVDEYIIEGGQGEEEIIDPDSIPSDPFFPCVKSHPILNFPPTAALTARQTIFSTRVAAMKLIVQIPCFNEEKTLPETVRDIPRHIPGFDQVELQIIDDGSKDSTVAVAKSLGVEHIVRMPRNQGLARAFSAGLDHALHGGADVIVNTDGDNQYCGADIPALVAPLLEGRADMVIGARPIESIQDFSYLKKKLQRLGSSMVSMLAGIPIQDTTSGFRAFNREAALRMLVLSRFSYTLDTIFQASAKDLVVANVPIRTNPKTRPSRLFRNIPHYIVKSLRTIFSVFTVYKPLPFFSTVGSLIFIPGLLLCLRFLYYYLQGQGSGKIQSLILAAVLIITGFQVFMIGILSHITATNRRILEETLYRLKKIEIANADRH